jgi:hypothetical protein
MREHAVKRMCVMDDNKRLCGTSPKATSPPTRPMARPARSSRRSPPKRARASSRPHPAAAPPPGQRGRPSARDGRRSTQLPPAAVLDGMAAPHTNASHRAPAPHSLPFTSGAGMTPPRCAPTGRRTPRGPGLAPLPGPRPSRAPTVLPDRHTGRRVAPLASRPPPLTATPMLALVPPTSDAWTSRGDREGTRPAHAANADANTRGWATGAPLASPSGRCADARSAPGAGSLTSPSSRASRCATCAGSEAGGATLRLTRHRPALRRSSCLPA